MRRKLTTALVAVSALLGLSVVARADDNDDRPVPEASAEFATINGVAGYVVDRSYRISEQNLFTQLVRDALNNYGEARRAFFDSTNKDPLRPAFGFAVQAIAGSGGSPTVSTQLLYGGVKGGMDVAFQYSYNREFDAFTYSLGYDASPGRARMVEAVAKSRAGLSPGFRFDDAEFVRTTASGNRDAADAIASYTHGLRLAILADHQDVEYKRGVDREAHFTSVGGSVGQLVKVGRTDGLLLLGSARQIFYRSTGTRGGSTTRAGAVLAWQDTYPVARDVPAPVKRNEREYADPETLREVARWKIQAGGEYVWKSELDAGDQVGAFVRVHPAPKTDDRGGLGPVTEISISAGCTVRRPINETGFIGVRVSQIF